MEKEKVDFWFILIVRGVLFICLIGLFIYDKVLGLMPSLGWPIYGILGSVVLVGDEALEYVQKIFKK